jgi:4-hydroxymandelate oxidase
MNALPPVRELVNVHEVEAVAKTRLSPERFAALGQSDRRVFDRITLRPRMMQDVTGLDLSLELFGIKHFTPILLGPVAGLDHYHPDGPTLWRQGAQAAQVSGADWPVLEAGAPPPPAAPVLLLRGWDLASLAKLRPTTKAALVVKGILTVADARAAIDHGAQGIVVSNYGVPEGAAPLDVLPSIADAVAGRVPILVDGGFRRGTDIVKALALGARAVMIARPALWGLAAYGAEGVQHVLELLQAELARAVAMLGKANLRQLDRSAIRLHRW